MEPKYRETKLSEYNNALAAEIKAERTAQGIQIPELAETAGLTLASTKRIVGADLRDINITQIALIAKAFGITASELVERAEKRWNRMQATAVSEASGTNVIKFNPRTATATELDDNTGGAARAATGFDVEADRPDGD